MYGVSFVAAFTTRLRLAVAVLYRVVSAGVNVTRSV